MHETFYFDLTKAGTPPDLFIALFWPHHFILNDEDGNYFWSSLCGPVTLCVFASVQSKLLATLPSILVII